MTPCRWYKWILHQKWMHLQQSNHSRPWKFPGPGNFHDQRKSAPMEISISHGNFQDLEISMAHGNFHPPWKIPWPMEISMLALISAWTRGEYGAQFWKINRSVECWYLCSSHLGAVFLFDSIKGRSTVPFQFLQERKCEDNEICKRLK